MPDISARQLAANILLQVDEQGAFAAAAIADGLSASSLQDKDRGLLTELVYGSIRVHAFLRREIEQFAQRPPKDSKVMAHLVIAAYQIYFLERVPGFAAVNEAVEALKSEGFIKEAGFANAVLRKLVQKGRQSDAPQSSWEQAILASSPSWLRKRLQRELGESNALSILVGERRPRPTLRFFIGTYPEWLQESAERYVGFPGAFRYVAGGDPRRHPEHAQGQFALQELGAQMIAAYAQPAPGERVLDVCAGRGHKTLLFAESMRMADGSQSGELFASDLHEAKLVELGEQAARKKLSVTTFQQDWSQVVDLNNSPFSGTFDRIVVDAPCTGLGTLARRPEIMRKVGAEDPVRLAELQLKILKNTLGFLNEGGLLFFITCSVLKSEGEDVVQSIVDWVAQEGGELLAEEHPAPELRGRAWGAEAEVATEFVPLAAAGEVELGPRPALFRLLPQLDATDGYFMSRLRLRKKISLVC